MNQNINVSPKDIINSKNVVCEKCENNTFNNVFVIKSMSALLSPTGKELNLPIPVFSCVKCGHINAGFLPEANQA